MPNTPEEEKDRRLIERLLGDPSKYPQQLKAWIPRFLELSDVRIHANQVIGVQPQRVTTTQFGALAPTSSTEMEVLLEVDATNGVYWHLRYYPGSSSSYKWHFHGGPELAAVVDAGEATSSVSYTDLTTAGPSVTAPRAGDYDIYIYVEAVAPTGGAQRRALAAAKLGATATADAESIIHQVGDSQASAPSMSIGRWMRRTLAANDVVKLQYKSPGGGTSEFARRRIAIRPVRIS